MSQKVLISWIALCTTRSAPVEHLQPREKKPALPASFYHHSDWQSSISLTTRIHTGLVMCRDTGTADDTAMGTVGFGDTGDTWPRDWEPAEPFPPCGMCSFHPKLPQEPHPGCCREREGISHTKTSPCPSSHAAENQPRPSHWGKRCERQTWCGDLSPTVQRYPKANDKQSLFLQWPC